MAESLLDRLRMGAEGDAQRGARVAVPASIQAWESTADLKGASLTFVRQARLMNSLVLLAAMAALMAGCGGGRPDPASVSEPGEASAAAETGDVKAFCEEAQGLKEDGQRPEGDEERETPAARFTAMAKVAPSAIRDDVEVVRAMWVDAEANNVAVVIGGEDAAANIRPYSELMARHPNTREAGARISAYVSKECGFFL